MSFFSKKDEAKSSGNTDALPPVLVGISTLEHTGKESISLDASIVEVYTKVKLEPNQKVIVPTMLARHWLKKPFFSEVK